MTASRSTCLVLALLSWPAAAPGSEPSAWLVGDARLTWQADEIRSNDGATTTVERLQLRARLGAESILGEQWRLRARMAGRFSDDQDSLRFWSHPWTPTRTGLRNGDVAIDELFIRFLPANDKGSVRIGRFQSRFALNDLMSKSLDHRDSPGGSVTWTNGVHWRYHINEEWRWHTVVRVNASSGASAVTRPPLVFSDSDSRLTWFTGLQALHPRGPIAEHMIGVTWMPDTLASDGLDAPRRDDYLAFTARGLVKQPLGDTGMHTRLGAEFGYAPNTPSAAALGFGDRGRTGGTALHLSAGLYDFIPRHDVSIVYGFAEAGWLISPNFRENDTLVELRYRWRVNPHLSVQARIRQREERTQPAGAAQARADDGYFLRLDLRL